MVDASMRFTERSKTYRSIRLREAIWTAIISWIVIFAIFHSAPVKAVVAATLGTLIAALLTKPMHRSITQGRVRKLIKEAHGDENAFPCEVELGPDAVRFIGRTAQIMIEWKDVEEISVTTGSVDIYGRATSIVVRDRAFASAEEKRQFIELAQSYLNAAKPTSK